MNSRERLLAAMRCEPVDHVPCAPWFFRYQRPGLPPCADDSSR
jgi:hypothetical protein